MVTVLTADPQPAAASAVTETVYTPASKLFTTEVVAIKLLLEFFQL
jgi:hypothetical protein